MYKVEYLTANDTWEQLTAEQYVDVETAGIVADNAFGGFVITRVVPVDDDE